MKKIDFSEMENALQFDDKSKTVTVFDYDNPSKIINNGTLLLAILNENIVTEGMDQQDTVNEYGKELYSLYDSILDQFKMN